MNNIKNFCDFICNFERTDVSIDVCHNMLLFGTILSHKPEKICELGIGHGYVTMAILHAIKYNGKGSLTSVDNYADWRNKTQPSELFNNLIAAGTNIIAPISEEQFVKSQSTDEFDLLVSDADHKRSGEWVNEIFRIVKKNGIIFVHDVFYTPSVRKYLDACQMQNKPYFLFNESSRNDEECKLGWLMIKNTKE